MKRGDTFQHRHWLDQSNQPLRCVVTKTEGTTIYWKAADGGKSYHFDLSEKGRYVLMSDYERAIAGIDQKACRKLIDGLRRSQ